MQKIHEISEAQQHVVLTVLHERDRLIKRTVEALDAIASAFAAQAGLKGEWIFESAPGQPIRMIPAPGSEDPEQADPQKS